MSDSFLYFVQRAERKWARLCFFGSRQIGGRWFLGYRDLGPRKRLVIRLEER